MVVTEVAISPVRANCNSRRVVRLLLRHVHRRGIERCRTLLRTVRDWWWHPVVVLLLVLLEDLWVVLLLRRVVGIESGLESVVVVRALRWHAACELGHRRAAAILGAHRVALR